MSADREVGEYSGVQLLPGPCAFGPEAYFVSIPLSQHDMFGNSACHIVLCHAAPLVCCLQVVPAVACLHQLLPLTSTDGRDVHPCSSL